MSDRDELIELVWDGAVADRVKDGLDPEFVPVVRPKVEAMADAILAAGFRKETVGDELSQVKDELANYKRGAKTLGEIIENQCRDVLDVTGLHHLINSDGDGHWDVVWMRLFEMRAELADLKESTIGRERKRGDHWRDRAQDLEVSSSAMIERLQAAVSAVLALAQEWKDDRANLERTYDYTCDRLDVLDDAAQEIRDAIGAAIRETS